MPALQYNKSSSASKPFKSESDPVERPTGYPKRTQLDDLPKPHISSSESSLYPKFDPSTSTFINNNGVPGLEGFHLIDDDKHRSHSSSEVPLSMPSVSKTSTPPSTIERKSLWSNPAYDVLQYSPFDIVALPAWKPVSTFLNLKYISHSKY
jgi:hypothetical protein